MSRLNRWSWLASRPRRRQSPRRKQHDWVGSLYARRLRVEALEDRRMLAGVEGFTGPYAISNWTSSGILDGFTFMSPAVGDSPTAEFSYEVDLPSGGVSERTADFTLASSLVTGSVTFDYTYTGNHRYHQAEAEFSTVINGFSQSVVVNSPTSGGFNFSGSASLIALADDPFGFRIGGKNFDSSSHIDGTLTISNITFHDSLVVDSADDEIDYDFSLGNFSLREAVYIANVIPGADKITIAPSLSGQTISLDMGELEITKSLTIDASDLAEPLTIDGQQLSRVLNFSALSGDLTLTGLTMQNGRTTGDGEGGGGIRFASNGTLTLIESILSGNSTMGSLAEGGGIYTLTGAVTLNQSTVSGNSTMGSFAEGGAIYTGSGDVSLNQSTLSGNSTGGLGASGGAIYTNSGDVSLNQSTLSGNSTTGFSAEGGAIYATSGDVKLIQSTLSGNSTTGDIAHGGAIFVRNSSVNPSLTIRNSIVAGNTVGAGSTGPDVVADPGGALTVNFSLIGTGITPTAGGNNISTNTPLLGPLADNGGPTLPNGATILTHALLADSPAINGGDPAVLFNAAEFDQRGAPFVRVVGTRVDMGAVESPYVIVNSAGGGDDGIPTNGITTLREAINLANSTPDVDESILFSSNMSGQTILLGGTQLEITDTLTIDATALAENVTIDAQQQSRVIHFSNPNEDDLTLAGLTIQNGRTTGDGSSNSGGGIRFMSEGTLAVTESVLSGNSTTGNATGGAIYSEHGAVALASSTLSGNSTEGFGAHGGGIYSGTGVVTLTNSTLSGNSTAGSGAHGGGIFSNHGDVALASSTLSGNSTAESGARGGGIYSGTGAVSLTNSTLSGNNTAGSGAHGGGIYSEFGAVTLNQSTLAGNCTTGNDADGGGISTDFGNVMLNQSTLSGNSTAGASANGGGISTNFGTVIIRNSIVAGNTVAMGSTGPDLVPDPLNTVTVNYSVIGTEITPAAGGNNFSTNVPLLGPLANNGGPTQTHALLPGSPALEAGDPNSGGAAHVYELNNSLADALGGPALDEEGGALTPTAYQFGPNEGLDLSSAVAADEYSIELVFSFDALGGYQKIIDFHDLADDTGLYSIGPNLHFYDAAFAENVFEAGVPVHLVVTRDAATDVVAVYANGIEVLSFVDLSGIAEFTGLSNIVRFFQDDNVSGGAEAASGFVDRIRIYNRDLSSNEVRDIALDQRGAPFVRVFDGDGVGGAQIDIGAFESQPIPAAFYGDYNQNGVVDAADYTVWRDSLGQTYEVPYSGADGNGNKTVGEEDFLYWRARFGETVPPWAGSGAAAATLAKSAFTGGEAIAPPIAAPIAAPADVPVEATVEAKANAVRSSDLVIFTARSAPLDSATVPRVRTNNFSVTDSVGDQLLLLLASDRLGHASRQDLAEIHDRGIAGHQADDLDEQDLFCDPLALALAEWP